MVSRSHCARRTTGKGRGRAELDESPAAKLRIFVTPVKKDLDNYFRCLTAHGRKLR
jgi:hypothetical protein